MSGTCDYNRYYQKLTSSNALIHEVKRRFNPSKNNKEKSFLRFFKSKQTSNRMIA